jgi:hypothetical protein
VKSGPNADHHAFGKCPESMKVIEAVRPGHVASFTACRGDAAIE